MNKTPKQIFMTVVNVNVNVNVIAPTILALGAFATALVQSTSCLVLRGRTARVSTPQGVADSPQAGAEERSVTSCGANSPRAARRPSRLACAASASKGRSACTYRWLD